MNDPQPELDPFSALGPLNPVPDAEALRDPARSTELLRRVLSDATASVRVLPSSRQRRQRRIIVVVAVGAVVAAAAFAWVAVRGHDDPLSLSCYATASLESDRTQVPPAHGDPRDICASEWVAGRVTGTRSDPPPLIACVRDEGSVAVLPATRGTACSRFGWADLDPNANRQADFVIRAHDQLVTAFRSEPCLDLHEAHTTARRILEANNLDWIVSGPPEFPAERPCASLAIDPNERTVTLVPVPRLPAADG